MNKVKSKTITSDLRGEPPPIKNQLNWGYLIRELKGLIRDWSLLRMLCFCIWHLTQKSKAIHKKEKQKEMERNHTKTQQDFFFILFTTPFSFTLLNIWTSCGLPLWKIVKSLFLLKGLIRDWSLLSMLCFCIWHPTQKRKAIHKKEKQKEMERNHTKTQQKLASPKNFLLFTTPLPIGGGRIILANFLLITPPLLINVQHYDQWLSEVASGGQMNKCDNSTYTGA